MTVLQQQTRNLQMDREEREEIFKRKNCAIIYGLPEPTGDSGENRKKNDELKIMDVFHQIKCDTISVNSFFRLGEPREGLDALP